MYASLALREKLPDALKKICCPAERITRIAAGGNSSRTKKLPVQCDKINFVSSAGKRFTALILRPPVFSGERIKKFREGNFFGAPWLAKAMFRFFLHGRALFFRLRKNTPRTEFATVEFMGGWVNLFSALFSAK